MMALGLPKREERRSQEIARLRHDALRGASHVFAAKGYHDAQMTDIARAADMSRATLYAMFKGKEVLFQEVISQTATVVRDTVRSKVETVGEPDQQLLAVIDSLFGCFEENRYLLRLYALGTNGLSFQMREIGGEPVLQVFEEFMDWVTGIARRAKRAGYLKELDAEAVAVSLLGAVTAAAAHCVGLASDRSLPRAGLAIRAVFARLLGVQREPTSRGISSRDDSTGAC